MIKSNGGVFGRNPTFNDVTVDGNLTVNGDIALGDDIVVADSLTVQGTEAATSTTTGALRVAGGISTQDGLYTGADAVINGIPVGRKGGATSSVVIGNGAGAALTNVAGNVLVGSNSGATLATGASNVVIGNTAGQLMSTSSNSAVLIGTVAGERYSGINGVFIGNAAGQYGREANVGIGFTALQVASTFASAVAITTPGTGGTPGGPNTIGLVYISGPTALTYPTISVTVDGTGAVSAASIVTPGNVFTGTGTVMGPDAAAIALGVPTNFTVTFTTTPVNRSVAVGGEALRNCAQSSDNTAVGASALRANVSGGGCTAIGSRALQNNVSGASNVAIGDRALQLNVLSGSNVAVGNSAFNNLNAATAAAGQYNVGVGMFAGLFVTTGANNTLVGADIRRINAGGNLTSADNSVVLGYDARLADNAQTNQVVIGASARGDGSNTTVIGNTSTTSTRIPAGNLTLSNGDLILGTAGNGISFAATTEAAGMTSELLDDYEEGTWTPSLNFSGVTTGITYTQNIGTYTKVGNLVRAHCKLILSSKGVVVGNAAISGLPFAASSTGGAYPLAGARFFSLTFADQFMGFVSPSGSSIILEEVSNAGTRTLITNADFADTTDITLALVYNT